MFTYKRNLAVLVGRYGDVERKVLKVFADRPEATYIDLPGGLQVFLLYLLEDGLLLDGGMAPWATQIQRVNTHDRYFLTEKGRTFVKRWTSAEPLA